MKPVKISQLKIPKGYSLEKTGLTQSLAHAFSQCPLKFLLKINRWQSKKNQEKFLIGNIVHDVLSIIYKSDKSNIRYLINKYPISKYIDKTKIEYYKTVAYCLLIKYVNYYQEDFKTAKFTNTEREFAVVINDIIWRGKIDGEYTIKKDKSLWILETKNKSRITDDTIQRGLSMDFQGKLYCKAKEVEFKKKVSGFLYNLLRIPQSKPHQNETLEQFSKRLQSDIDKRPEYYFMRWEVPFTDQDKEEFDIDLQILISDLMRFINFNGCYKIRNTFSCTDGITPCEYLDACIQGHTGGYYQEDKIFTELSCGL